MIGKIPGLTYAERYGICLGIQYDHFTLLDATQKWQGQCYMIYEDWSVTFDTLKSKNENIHIIQCFEMKSSCGRNDLNHVKLAIIF